MLPVSSLLVSAVSVPEVSSAVVPEDESSPDEREDRAMAAMRRMTARQGTAMVRVFLSLRMRSFFRRSCALRCCAIFRFSFFVVYSYLVSLKMSFIILQGKYDQSVISGRKIRKIRACACRSAVL